MRQPNPPVQVAPGRWLLPRLPPAHSDALVRLGADCRELEAVLARVADDAQWVIADLRRDWTGPAARAVPQPMAQLVRDMTTVRRALRGLAEELDRLAAALDRAEEQHEVSWQKVLAVSAVVAVSAAAVVVTVGSAGTATPAAAAAETAAVSAAAGEMAAASTAAASAEVAAAEGFLAAARLARSVEALRAIVVPRIAVATMQAPVWVETPLGAATVGAGSTAGLEWLEDGRVTWADVGLSAVLGAGESYVLSPGRSRGFVTLTDATIARRLTPARRAELLRFRSERAAHDRPISMRMRQVESHQKHAGVLDVPANFSRANGQAFASAIRDFVARPDTMRIDGLWKGKPAIFYTDFDTRVVAICHADGDFVSLFRMSPKQHWHVWHDGAIGGR